MSTLGDTEGPLGEEASHLRILRLKHMDSKGRGRRKREKGERRKRDISTWRTNGPDTRVLVSGKYKAEGGKMGSVKLGPGFCGDSHKVSRSPSCKYFLALLSG